MTLSDSTMPKHETPSPDTEITPCPHCFGSGACGSCGGTGTVYRPGPLVPWDPFPIDPECLTCGGTGDCEYCHGTGAADLRRPAACQTPLSHQGSEGSLP